MWEEGASGVWDRRRTQSCGSLPPRRNLKEGSLFSTPSMLRVCVILSYAQHKWHTHASHSLGFSAHAARAPWGPGTWCTISESLTAALNSSAKGGDGRGERGVQTSSCSFQPFIGRASPALSGSPDRGSRSRRTPGMCPDCGSPMSLPSPQGLSPGLLVSSVLRAPSTWALLCDSGSRDPDSGPSANAAWAPAPHPTLVHFGVLPWLLRLAPGPRGTGHTVARATRWVVESLSLSNRTLKENENYFFL